MIETERSRQYRDSRRLRMRGKLHEKYANRNWFEWVADRAGPALVGDIVDIGCGPGWFWASAVPQPRDARLTLVDRSPAMVTEALRRLSGAGRFGAVVGRAADAVSLPFAARSFDTATAMHMLYHVAQPARAIDELARILKPGGSALITTNGDANLMELFSLGGAAFGGATSDPAAAAFGVDAARAHLGRRFQAVDVHIFEDSYAIDDVDDIIDYLTSFPPGSAATREQHDALRRLAAENLAANGGVLAVKREAALIWARRPSAAA